MAEAKGLYPVIDAGGTFLKSAVMDREGEVRQGSEFTTPSRSDGSKEEIIASLGECIASALSFAAEAGEAVKGIGISIPGPFHYGKGISLMEHKFSALYKVNLREEIRRLPGIPPGVPVCFMHDANAVLMGEQWLGNARPYRNSAVITLGTGIGFSHSQNRVVQCNDLGSPSVSIYRTPYKAGILEDYVSRRGILNIYKELNGNRISPDTTVHQIGKQADEGDPLSREAFRRAGAILSEAVTGILQEKHIECLLLGGQISRSYSYMEESLRAGLCRVPSLRHISPVKNIDHAAFYGILANLNS